MENKETFGKCTVGFGTREQSEIAVTGFVKATFLDDRVVSASTLEDGTFVIAVENPESSGRAPHQSMRLSKESLFGILSTVQFLLIGNEVNMEQGVKESIGGDHVIMGSSTNLTDKINSILSK